MLRRRLLPLGLMAAGVLLLLGSGLYAWYTTVLANPAALRVPPALAGQALTHSVEGVDAVAEVTRLHGKDFPLSSGAMARYGTGITLWASGAPASPMAAEMVRAMRDKIAEGRSPFTPLGTRQAAGREVYELEGMGQRHFYFQSGPVVVWLAADAALADAALADALAFYAPGGPGR